MSSTTVYHGTGEVVPVKTPWPSVLYLALLVVVVAAVAVAMGMPFSALLGPAGVVFILYAVAAWAIGRFA
jgi:hypothetical protein